jgi:hypothetical protein
VNNINRPKVVSLPLLAISSARRELIEVRT